MKTKKIYIASSWKNQHAVEMLTSKLRALGYVVFSWVENNFGEDHNHVTKKFDFEDWVNSSESNQSFQFDTDSVLNSDLVIYLGPGGKDACVELGIAWGRKIPIVGLWAKGEDLGLMRKCVKRWFTRYPELLEYVDTVLSPARKLRFSGASIISILILFLCSCSSPYWAVYRNDGLEKKMYLKQGWPRDHKCTAYTNNRPIKRSTWANQFYYRHKREKL
jgi:hypothetical protein